MIRPPPHQSRAGPLHCSGDQSLDSSIIIPRNLDWTTASFGGRLETALLVACLETLPTATIPPPLEGTMNARRSFPLFVLGLLALVGCQPQAAQFTPQDEAAIRAEFSTSRTSYTTGDPAAWLGAWSDSGVIQPPNAPSVHGHAALEAWFRAFQPAVDSVTWPNIQVHGDGNMAWATTDYAVFAKSGAPDHGKQLVVMQRDKDGKWLVVAASFNSDLPVPAAAPAPASASASATKKK